jgi:SAM-dependent methyltransferase
MNIKTKNFSDEEISQQFAKFPVWTTQFEINGKKYGGVDDALIMDQRLVKLNEVCPVKGKTVLELGPLEAAHTYTLLQLGAKSVTAVEYREENLEKCKIIKKLLGMRKAKFLQGDVRSFDFSALGKFDIVLCSGVLYHLLDPLALLQKLSKITDTLFLWTHIATDTYPPMQFYREENSLEAGLEQLSFWLKEEELLWVLDLLGFYNVDILSKGILYGNSAHILICASKALKIEI